MSQDLLQLLAICRELQEQIEVARASQRHMVRNSAVLCNCKPSNYSSLSKKPICKMCVLVQKLCDLTCTNTPSQ